MFLPQPWDKNDTKEVGKAVLIAAAGAFVIELIRLGFDELKERRRKETKS